MAQPAAARQARLLEALRDPRCYPHPVQQVELLETHISAVLLAGAFAYKIKKPVALGFLDFRSLESRRHFCSEELRLNRRTAAQLYIDVVPITGSPAAPVIGGEGRAIEYALKMRRFPQEHLLDALARSGNLSLRHIASLAQVVAAFHAAATRADPARASGSPQKIVSLALENYDEINALRGTGRDEAMLQRLRGWTLVEHERRLALFDARLREGFVRECHGDLHLGNVALLEGVPTPFDCIEFNEDLRWIDVINEAAFLVMDLLAHRLPKLAFGFLDAYLQHSGDYGGVGLLRFYALYRALVRAKVAAIRARQSEAGTPERASAETRYREHLELAGEISAGSRPALVLMQGLSGSGKSSVAAQLVGSLGAIRCRSDVERKRLHGLEGTSRTDSGLAAGIYSQTATLKTYERLAAIAGQALEAGYPVIVDAAFLKRAQRDRFRALARRTAVPFAVVSCTAPLAELRERVARREAQGDDASEAGIAVLERQLKEQEAFTTEESAFVLSVDTGSEQARAPDIAAALAERLGITLSV